MSDQVPETAPPAPATQPERPADPAPLQSVPTSLVPGPYVPAPPVPQSPVPGPYVPASPAPEHHSIPNWLRQVERVLRVLVRLYLGLLVCFAPWYPQAWDDNPLFSQPQSLHHFITLGAVRGIVSGLGLLNLWIALTESLHSSAERDT